MGEPAPAPAAFPPSEWASSEWYRYGIDLYNHRYYWECHEVFEALWHAAGHETDSGRFFRALIQVAAGNLKRELGSDRAASNLYRAGLRRLNRVSGLYMGLDVAAFIRDVEAYALRLRHDPPMIRLTVPRGAAECRGRVGR